ncbi:MAG TPA: DUF499 domain-containing protein, partial [Verrucomicrobiae bacterium]|nr:DUF499 domain-containing protein [Verrucomicrobiae bacterium]
MKLKPWYDVIKPREDLREGKSQDASEFAVHLDRVRDGTAREDYKNPDQFFSKTFLASNLLDLAAQTVRRLSGETSHTSPVFNLATNFGGGKTHALTLLYHLASNGPASKGWLGVSQILDKANVRSIPKARVAVFVGTEFDTLAGRGGQGGDPKRTTPWGEVAYQLGGKEGFKVVKEHDERRIAPGGDVLRKIIPANEPCLILMDELLNYSSRFRSLGLNTQLYDFLLNLSGSLNQKSVLAVSVPASELEMTAEDVADYDRLTKMLDRVGKALTMTAGAETSEVIRRRLFDWDPRALNAEGKVMLPKDAQDTCHEFARWVNDHSHQLGSTIPREHARAHFEVSYPFHPSVLSVFERKWQSVPKFQQTRGILRLLALWIQNAYNQAYRKAHPDPLLFLGIAPFGDPIFRAAVFEQLGSRALETAVTVDIAGRKESHAKALDEEANESIQKERLHQKVATTVFFESNGGTTRSEATIPDIRLAVGHPDLDLGNIETALDALTDRSYYLSVERKNYRFSLRENLNKRFSDKRANVAPGLAEETIRQEVQKVFSTSLDVGKVPFPEKTSQVPDQPALTFVILPPEASLSDEKQTLKFIEKVIKECGSSGRTFKSALIFCVPEAPDKLRDAARRVLAWEAIQAECDEDEQIKKGFDEAQLRQLSENVRKARRDLREVVWQTYKSMILLDKNNKLRTIDLGMPNSSMATDFITVLLDGLKKSGELEPSISPNLLLRNWPAMKEWPVSKLRDAFFSSPKLPRILTAEILRDTISRGVANGIIAYVGKASNGSYKPFLFNGALSPAEIEFSPDMFVIRGDDAKKHVEPAKLTTLAINPPQATVQPGKELVFTVKGFDQHGHEMPAGKVQWECSGGKVDRGGNFRASKEEGEFTVTVTAGSLNATADVTVGQEEAPPPEPPATEDAFTWSGNVPPQKWMNFY